MEKLYYSRQNARTKYELVCNSTQSSDLLYYTNGSYRVLVEFCVDEVFEIQGDLDMRGIKETQKLKLGDAQGTPR